MLFSTWVPVSCVYFGAQHIGIVISRMLVIVEVLLILLKISVAWL